MPTETAEETEKAPVTVQDAGTASNTESDSDSVPELEDNNAASQVCINPYAAGG